MMEIHFLEPETSEMPEKMKKRGKREPNMFILYRKDMIKDQPHNMSMTELSKLASERWKRLSDHDKAQLQRSYQISRDRKRKANPISNDDRRTNFKNSDPPMANLEIG